MKIKGFNKNLQCRGHQFEVGKEYKIESNNKPELCTDTVFHYCNSLHKVHSFYSVNPSEANRFCEIEPLSPEVSDDEKAGASHIRIVREIVGDELNQLRGLINGNTGLFNSGDRNSGSRNSGSRNSGSWNSGDQNSGSRNSGNWNSGNWNSGYGNSGGWNSGDQNSGFFNTSTPETIDVFDKPCNRQTWKDATKPSFLYFDLAEWIVDETKPTGGYLKTYTYKEAFQNSYNKLTPKEKQKQTELLKALPNFDKQIFFEISGILID